MLQTCIPAPKFCNPGNCSYWICSLTHEAAPSPCCPADEFEPLTRPIDGPFVPVADQIKIIDQGHGFVRIQPERMSRQEFGKVDSSTFELAIPTCATIQSGQWVLIDRSGLTDHGQITAIDRRSPFTLKVTVDTAKVLPFDLALVCST